MAQGRLNPILDGMRGRIGDLVVKQYGSKVVYTRRPVFRNRVFTGRQLAAQERFRKATLFARELMVDPIARKVYEEEARVKGKSAWSLMVSDFLHARLPGRSGSDLKNSTNHVCATKWFVTPG